MVDGFAPEAIPLAVDKSALLNAGLLIPYCPKVCPMPLNDAPVKPPIKAPVNAPLTGSVPLIRLLTVPIPPPYNEPVPALLKSCDATDGANPVVVPAVPAADPAAEYPAV